ncbi:dicer-like protein 4 isoform X2 [Senna tora]|uniref:Dicer-like protein 4 isoform X2 n=1 Tax=Senna tora TaxID=362788 RepID=A0A834X6G5_9FABA|nr:dicer-like protein 4 isoform X2 [Senna tora]
MFLAFFAVLHTSLLCLLDIDGVIARSRRVCCSDHGGSPERRSIVFCHVTVRFWSVLFTGLLFGYSLYFLSVLACCGIDCGEDHKGISDGERCNSIRVDHGVKVKEQGNNSTFRKVLRIFLEDRGKRRVQCVLERQDVGKASKHCIAAGPLTTVARVTMGVKQDGRLLCWVPRGQSQVQQGSSTQKTGVQTDPVQRNVGVQTEEAEMITLGDVRVAEPAGKGEMGTKVGEEGEPKSASCKGKAIMEAQVTNNVVIRDPSTSGIVKHLEPHTDSSSSEAEEGEFFDEASIISFFDNEEGLLIEQLEKEYEDQESDQKIRLDDALEGVASLLGMDVSEGNINDNSRGILTMPEEEPRELGEYFIHLPPELCQLKIVGFSKDIGSSVSLLPSIMHRLGNLLVAIELKHLLCSFFPEAAEVSAHRILEALTTEKCQERFSLERLEVLGDAFLKFAVARHFFLLNDSLHEGDLTRKRSNVVNNSNLFKLAIRRNLQVFDGFKYFRRFKNVERGKDRSYIIIIGEVTILPKISMANLDKRIGYLEREMMLVKKDIGIIKECMRDIHDALVRLCREEELEKTEKKPIKWSSSWNKLENFHVSQEKKGEDEVMELKNAFGT